MNRRAVLTGIGSGALAAALPGLQAFAQAGNGVVFELREYHASEGKLDALLARFRDHTMTIFKRHNLEVVGFWTPTDDPLKGKTLIYILRHASRETAVANWAAFHADPEWQKVSAASEVNGKLTEKVDSTFMTLTDFSPKL